MVAEFGRILDLFGRALIRRSDLASFCRRMNEAASKGLKWTEALEQVADKRLSLHDL